MKSSADWHVMSVLARKEHRPSPAEIMFKFGNLDVSKTKTFRMFYKVLKETSDSAAFHFKVGNIESNIQVSSTNLNSWIPFCTEVTVEKESTVSFVITATNVSVAIDDVSLKDGVCPEVSTNCTFDDDFLCGYSTEYGWKYTSEMDNSKNKIGYARVVQSGQELLSPPFENIDRSKVCITADVRTSQDQEVDTAPHLHLVLRDVETNTELLLRHDSLPVISAEWQTLKYQVSNVVGEYNIAWKVTLGDSEYLDIRSVSIINGDCISQLCANDQFECKGDDYTFCMPLQQVCRNIHLCPNAASTVCRPTVSCDFNDSFYCGWTLYGASVENGESSGMVLFLGGAQYTYAETPLIEVMDISCMTLTMLRDFNNNMCRLLRNDSNNLVEVNNFDMFKSQGRVQSVQIELPVGNYTLVFECRQINEETSYVKIDDVSVISGTCDQIECRGYKCKKDETDKSGVTVCFDNDDVVCDKFIDCPYDTDENKCDYTFECDFDTDICGYDVSGVISLIKLPYSIDGTDVTIPTANDTGNDRALLYNSMLNDRLNFTTGPIVVPDDACAVTMDMWIHIFQPFSPGEAFLFMTAGFSDRIRRINTFTRNINLNVTETWFQLSIPLYGSSFNPNDWSVGFLSTGRYIPSFSFVAYGVYVAIDNISTQSCNETDKTDELPPDFDENNRTSTNLPENFPTTVIDNAHVVADFLDTVSLLCSVENLGQSQVTLHWYKDEVQISRNNEIINQDVTTIYDLEMLKYTVMIDNDPTSGKLNYSLILHRVSKADAGAYSCKIELDGLSDVSNIYVTVNTRLALSENNCYKNTLPTCQALGFDEVIPKGPLGFREVQDAALHIQDIEHSITFEKMSKSCQRSIMTLQCGLLLPKCQDGNPIHVCREHCESIIEGCHVNNYDNNLFLKLQQGCKFLHFVNESGQCLPITVGCGLEYTGHTGSIVSVNYPDSYPVNSKCEWHIAVEPYHMIQFEVVYYDVDANTGSSSECGLSIRDNTTASLAFNCSENVPLTFQSSGNTATLTFQSDSESSGNGFYIKYRQIPMDTCISMSGENMLHLNASNNPFDESCNKLKIYLQDARDTLDVMIDYLADGCITLLDNLQLNVTLCNITEKLHYEVQGYMDINIESLSTIYQIKTQKRSYVRSVQEVTIDNAGRLQILSEGEFGTMCGDLEQFAADLICKSMNHGWPAKIEKGLTLPEILPRLASDIQCNGEEAHITQCRFVFTPLESETCMDSFYTRQIINCPQTTISCDFTKSTCGYVLDDHVKFSPLYGLYHVGTNHFSNGVAMSIPFTYTTGVYMYVEYIIRRGDIGAGITINLVQSSSNASFAVWKWQSFQTYGIFKDVWYHWIKMFDK
ncbi:uncharacterized protein LOC132755868 [Ruditapes philippinarum]|uniref:uncharacterized protein LOC132755868 n=1 Tax=Ruditapes philippinarum TaxID=129788 RepID=UPI00295A9617|nr:uncharacterized protein LOC132755868 [Ruditapes philippinarum]